MKPLRVLLVEDHALVRAGFRALLHSLPEIEVIMEASDGLSALDLVESDPPDIVLMDISMPRLNGLETAARIIKRFPGVRVILLSMHTNEEYILRALRIGVDGYLLKDAQLDELREAIITVAAGGSHLSPQIASLVADYAYRVGPETTPLDLLTPRQRAVLQLIVEGHTTKGIGSILGISEKTVESHRMALMERLRIYDVVGLVHYALRVGLIVSDG